MPIGDIPILEILLRQLLGKLDDDFFVKNGDLLTDLDFSGLMAHHRANGAAVTVSTYTRAEKNDLGVLKVDGSGELPDRAGAYRLPPDGWEADMVERAQPSDVVCGA